MKTASPDDFKTYDYKPKSKLYTGAHETASRKSKTGSKFGGSQVGPHIQNPS